MHNKVKLRGIVRENLSKAVSQMNSVLRGRGVKKLEAVLARIGGGGTLPHWYRALESEGVLPNLDGKTIGSVVEMLFVGILETSILADAGIRQLKINPARGVDLPDLDLGVKSPSKNYCTSEPFISAYHRMLGSEFDIVVLLTDYQAKKKTPPLQLQIIDSRYLKNTQVADRNLCNLAKRHRSWLIKENEATAQKLFRFLAYVNQSDWRARWLLKLIDGMRDEQIVLKRIKESNTDFVRRNNAALKNDKPVIPDADLDAINRIQKVHPAHIAVIEAAENWVLEVLKDAARPPSEYEWRRFRSGPLDGQIGMSFALQWRYNFGQLFGKNGRSDEPIEIKL
ncbi:MAG: hypothetical protein HY288_19120 [Planctomycetia bacterium]|nr:hypothetical protein [Planctomycetia bacterium]